MHHLKLLSELGVLSIISSQQECLARMNIREATHDRDEVTLIWGFKPGYRVARVLSMVCDPFHYTLEAF
jgi:hypothetical protein